MTNNACRCGHTGDDKTHPCHGKAYTCRKPSQIRFYNAAPVALSGMQMKLQVQDTWACDDCWDAFKKLRKEEKGKLVRA